MAYQEKQLAQSRVNGTSAVSLYSPGASETAIIRNIWIANTSGAAATYRLFVDDDGTTYDATTAIAYDVNVDSGEIVKLEVFIPMNVDAGNFAARSSVSDALTFTLFGVLIT